MDDTSSPGVALHVATPADAALLSNLVELYAHDLSATFALELGEDGRFGYAKLPLYWSEPDRRFPFLIRSSGKVAGFALITRGSPASDDPEVFDVVELFIARRHRRSGVGRQAAFLLWNRFAARWTVRVSEGNRGGRDFWTSTITACTRGEIAETTRPGRQHAWHVLSFDSMNQVAKEDR